MRTALSIAAVVFCLSLFGWLVYTTPAPYSDDHRAFTPKDLKTIERDYPGGTFQSARLYVFCFRAPNQIWGELVYMHSDGRVIWPKASCWRFPREL